ncbi:hypothetical protein [Roseobacter sp. HKCC-CH-9208]|uniref:hypothetical protein n=1 Tax=Roseobacter sp. HKCC-CH-9208 TaxID=3120339 RepID=UPI0030EF18FA
MNGFKSFLIAAAVSMLPMTVNAQSLMERYNLVGQWNIEPSLCGLDSETFLEIRPDQLFFMYSGCDINKQYEQGYDIVLELTCFGEGDEWESRAILGEGDGGIISMYMDDFELFYEPCFKR